jgi:hypothetical protein
MAARDNRAGKKAVAKRMVLAKKTGPARKSEPKKAVSAKPAVKKAKTVAAPKPAAAPVRPTPTAGKPQVVTKPAVPAKAEKVTAPAKPPTSPMVSAPPKPASVEARLPASPTQQTEERRKAATRKFFARLRSLEAIVGADLRKRGSLVLMQAVDQWYSEAVSATATDVSITNAAKAVISHL